MNESTEKVSELNDQPSSQMQLSLKGAFVVSCDNIAFLSGMEVSGQKMRLVGGGQHA